MTQTGNERSHTAGRHMALLGAVLAGAIALCACAVDPARTRSVQAPVRGQADFQEHCASCHGRDGKGHGSVAQFLTVPTTDMTQLALVNSGTFPEDRVRMVIDGRIDVLLHGDRFMPVWGNAFREMEGEAAKPFLQPQNPDVIRRIDDLVAYIGTIQE